MFNINSIGSIDGENIFATSTKVFVGITTVKSSRFDLTSKVFSESLNPSVQAIVSLFFEKFK